MFGVIIDNPVVNEKLERWKIPTMKRQKEGYGLNGLTAGDVVIVPAFGAEVGTMDELKRIGCQTVDTTCGDVMSVWKRVRQYNKERVTSIIHGKSSHEETMATSSRALSTDGLGHYLVVYNLEETDYVCNYIRNGGDTADFLMKFEGAHSPGVDQEKHLQAVWVANQQTRKRWEMEEGKRRVKKDHE